MLSTLNCASFYIILFIRSNLKSLTKLDAHLRAGYLRLVIPAAPALHPTGTASLYTLSMVFSGIFRVHLGIP